MRILENMPIAFKCLIAPVISCILATVIAVAFVLSSQNVASVTKQGQQALSFADSTTAIKGSFQNTLADLYKILSWKQSNVDDKLINDALDSTKKVFADATHGVENIRVDGLDVDQGSLDKLKENFKQYSESFSQYLDTIGVDLSVAALYVNTIQSRYDSTSQALQSLQEAANKKNAALAESLQNTERNSARTVLTFVILTIIGSLAVGIIVGRVISKPIKDITSLMRQVADGHLDLDIPYGSRKDEIGDMARALMVFRENAQQIRKLEEDSKLLEEKATLQRKQMMIQLEENFRASVGNIVTIVSSAATELQENSQNLTELSLHTDQLSTGAAGIIQQSAANAQAVAAASEELSSSIGELNRQIAESVQKVQATEHDVKLTGEIVETLSGAAEEIGTVVKMIQEIAGQTNLLALNATIEAARAGDAGKGFAVVASEVKNLASQTARATEDIVVKIGTIQTSTTRVVEAVKNISQSVQSITAITARVTVSIQQQTDATTEISKNIQQVSVGSENAARSISDVANASQQSSSASKGILSAANDLSVQADKLRSEIEVFLRDIKA